MRLMRVLAIAAIAATFVQGEAVAQSNSSARVPAEFPPATYTGRQYVDSRGCVFIRAGIDGQTTWVPRVTRDRKVICGFKPSTGTATAATTQAAPTQPAKAPEPTVITVPKQTTAAAKPTAKPAVVPKRVATAPKKTVLQAPAAKPAPKAVQAKPKLAQTPKPVKTTKPVVTKTKRLVKGQSACKEASALSQQYLRSRNGLPVRCRPQTQPHATIISGGGGSGAATHAVRVEAAPEPVVETVMTYSETTVQPSVTRVAPRHVYTRQLSSTRGIFVPEGYKPVWEDDRLNPRRAHQTFEGKALMDLAWTKTVPRRLIDRETGREVTHDYPGLQYPYTSFDQQNAAGVVISTRGEMVPEPERVVRAADGSIRNVRYRTKRRQAEVVAPTISSRSSAPKAPAKAASHRYVQVGIFSEPGLAKRAAQRLANAGLPARMGKTQHKGQPYTSVVVGPFATQSQLQSGMSAVRRAGYPNAYYRK